MYRLGEGGGGGTYNRSCRGERLFGWFVVMISLMLNEVI